jgi:hypothetical protein
VVDRLQWDVKLYFALNGAVHDAAIAAWGLKGYYDSVRPISMIRYMGGLGQSSGPSLPSYNKEGLPLVPDLIELITKASTAPGQRHAALAGHEGQIAIRAWAGEYFPGGISGYTIKAGSLKFEAGPTSDIRLEWATYYDASDQAGQSRLWGGIHIQADDFTGRELGSACGKAAWTLAQKYYDGSVGS